MDRAYWITWYNLPAKGHDAYLSWLHTSYMPRVLDRPGILWAAHYASEENVVPLGGGKGRVKHTDGGNVPAGDRYILLFGAGDSQPFTTPSPNRFHAALTADDRRMLALREAGRTNIMVEQARAHGPDASKPPALAPSPCIQLGSFNAASYDDEDELAHWYAEWRLPSMRTVPGCVRVRKLVSVAGWAKHACLYEFTSLAARNENFIHYERAHPDMEAWSKAAVKKLIHAPGSANVAQRIALLVK